MEEKKVKKYMNPITLEAELFVESLNALSMDHNNIDANLVSSLEKVMNTIEIFLDTTHTEISDTETTKLVACNAKHIKRIYHCSKCKTDLGKCPVKVTRHLMDICPIRNTDSNSLTQSNAKKEHNNKRNKKINFDDDRNDRKALRNKRVYQAVSLTKKTVALLTSNHEQFLSDHYKIGEKLKCIPAYDMIERDLISLISPLFRGQRVKVYKFGSRLAGIGTRDSDLDIFIDIGGSFSNFENRPNADSMAKLYKVGQALSKSRKLWDSLVMIDRARVPILRVIHGDTSIECDINFSTSLGFINTQLLEYLFSIQPIARLLCIFIKKWLSRTGLNNDVSTYSLMLMVIFYLQSLKLLPSVERLQQNTTTGKVLCVGPWLCTYATVPLSALNISLHELTPTNMLNCIEGFFQFYVSFNYEECVVCPYLGVPVKRTEFEGLMPERYTNYVKNSADYAIKLGVPMAVQDPIQLNHNVTKGVSSINLQVFTTYMMKSLDVLHNTFSFEN